MYQQEKKGSWRNGTVLAITKRLAASYFATALGQEYMEKMEKRCLRNVQRMKVNTT
jgi:hypothetical protein